MFTVNNVYSEHCSRYDRVRGLSTMERWMLLRKTDVVDGALKFLDVEGLDGLTMRKLGATLNVQGGALYRHFPNKSALLAAMADKLVEGVGDPLPDAPWHEQI